MQTMLTDFIDRLRKRDKKWLMKKLGTDDLQSLDAVLKPESLAASYLPVWTTALLEAPAPVIFAVLHHVKPAWQARFMAQIEQEKRAAIDRLSEIGLSKTVLTLMAQHWLEDKERGFDQMVGEEDG